MPSKKYRKQIKEKCQECKNNLVAWIGSMNFNRIKEKHMKEHTNNFCSSCVLFKDIDKGRK